jgi:PAS domain-containing protein
MGRERLVLAASERFLPSSGIDAGAETKRRAAVHAAVRDHAWSGYLAMDENLIVFECNIAAAGLLDVTVDDVIGHAFSEFLPAPGALIVDSHLRHVLHDRQVDTLSGDPASFDGKALYFKFIPVPHGVAVLMRNEAEYLRALQDAEVLNATRRAMALCGGVANVRLDARGRIAEADDALTALVEFPKADVVGLRAIDLVAMGDRRRFSDALERVLHEKADRGLDIVLMRKTGGDQRVRACVTPIIDDFSVIGACLLLFSDPLASGAQRQPAYSV